jgi:hypothetical protein
MQHPGDSIGGEHRRQQKCENTQPKHSFVEGLDRLVDDKECLDDWRDVVALRPV